MFLIFLFIFSNKSNPVVFKLILHFCLIKSIWSSSGFFTSKNIFKNKCFKSSSFNTIFSSSMESSKYNFFFINFNFDFISIFVLFIFIKKFILSLSYINQSNWSCSFSNGFKLKGVKSLYPFLFLIKKSSI